MSIRRQPHLCVVSKSGTLDVPRRYAQSTSGRSDSTGTRPPLSRSSAITSLSPNLACTEIPLRRYPIVVPQRAAYSSCSVGSREFRYARSSSMSADLPEGKVKSIPTDHLPTGNRRYAVQVANPDIQADLYAVRRERLRELVREVGDGKQTNLAHAVAQKLELHPELADSLRSFTDATYISRALKGRRGQNGGKNIGEAPAAALEKLFQKPPGWMSRQTVGREQPWPFSFSRALWDQLDSEEKKEAERHLRVYLSGLVSSRQRQKAG